ncbi:hypothetical protein HG717_35025 [Rhodococcus erythropolis]|uniref:hypothetical protein n=1 Tax=Rhodococcus erythropolis TaxID=1833 RepID=UPI001C9A9DFD|nr:hypothetical protein [Rhodococcus erythropolis]MBY6389082.1 hypothetical protein [Rhodococcus erythropolis]
MPIADELKSRRDHLDAIVAGKNLDSVVRANLQEVWKKSAPAEIVIRSGFARRIPELVDSEIDGISIRDKPRPVLPRRPPLSVLAQKSKGVGLRLAVTLPFLVQSDRHLIEADSKFRWPIESTHPSPSALLDVVVVNANHIPGKKEFEVDKAANRKRQIGQAITALAEPEVNLLWLPEAKGQGYRKHKDIRLNLEDGGHRRTVRTRYQVPTPTEQVIRIPANFYLNGWIHALSNREIAMWLMLRDLHGLAGGPPGTELDIIARDRILNYDLTRAAWESYRRLADYGLITFKADPNRRADGTVEGGRRRPESERHRFYLTDDGLNEPGVATVSKQIHEECDRL